MSRVLPLVLALALPVAAADVKDVQALLARPVIGPRQARLELEEHVRPRIPTLPPPGTAAEWEKYAAGIRRDVLDKVVFRGEAARWRDRPLPVKWGDVVPGGPGYRLRKLRYEPIPGLWIPAVLYEPDKLTGKVPVFLNVNGHDGNGKAADYKQTRCINLAKRGILALNVEWLGMGQLRSAGYGHGRMNQLDLCGTSGLAVFYLSMSRGLDVLLGLEHADRTRVGVAGLSGGGWQTIFLSSLDQRVTLCNPVAGYSGFKTRLDHHKDLGDSEQTPSDLATVADYTHLTALLAPRPALLTYNAKDNCCFESGYALPPLLDAARPVYKLLGKESALGSHVNVDPGDHNFGLDNREALYRFLRRQWFADVKDWPVKEIDCAGEIKSKEDLAVELPADNANFNTLAKALARDLPREGGKQRRQKLAEILRVPALDHSTGTVADRQEKNGIKATFHKVVLGTPKAAKEWTLPVVELAEEKATGRVLLFGDAGRKNLAAQAERLVREGKRVFAVDLFGFGEAAMDSRPYLFDLMLATIGHRSLGLQARQLNEVARHLGKGAGGPLEVLAVGPRSGVIALCAAGLDGSPLGGLTLEAPLGSLKELIEQNRSFETAPELFCFGLLESFDVKQLAALAAGPLRLRDAGERAKKELAGLTKE